jgi:hypothetical protein|tara:strand:- start:190 stop:474 length:285 start_codon:yes stop_codon:yes gene_type:complete
MMTAIRGLLSSKKFWSAILGSVIAAVSDHLGIDQQTVFGILGLFGVQIAGQGLQDMGATKTRHKVDAAKKALSVEVEDLGPAEKAAALREAAGE